eukprot:COSAG05_NODE_3273_length_2187_cov_1.218870_3_plen_68_part_00
MPVGEIDHLATENPLVGGFANSSLIGALRNSPPQVYGVVLPDTVYTWTVVVANHSSGTFEFMTAREQ